MAAVKIQWIFTALNSCCFVFWSFGVPKNVFINKMERNFYYVMMVLKYSYLPKLTVVFLKVRDILPSKYEIKRFTKFWSFTKHRGRRWLQPRASSICTRALWESRYIHMENYKSNFTHQTTGKRSAPWFQNLFCSLFWNSYRICAVNVYM